MKNPLSLSSHQQNTVSTVLSKTNKTRVKRSVLSALAFAYCGASFYAAASLSTPNNPMTSNTEVVEQTVSLSWATINGASGYRLEEENEAGQFVEISTDTDVTHSVQRAPGVYRYRVIGCINDETNALVCNQDVADYSQITSVPVSNNPVPPSQIEFATAPTLQTITPQDDVSAQIGVMAGEFRVDESGAANYSVPIALPEGIAGVTPQLGLSYSSASGNGPLGIGWSIGGLSSIGRCRQTLEQDGQTKPLTLTNEDRFCLDGQKLVLVNNQDYGADTAEYRTEIDNKTRITSYGNEGGGPAYFVVEREDGSMTYYGNMSVDPDDVATDAIHTASSGAVLTWFISSISDNLKKTENSIYFDYNNGVDGFGENEITIDQIRYSDNTVKFNYTNNTATDSVRRSGYLHGNMIELKALLEDIEVTNHDETLLRTYKLTYGQDAESDVERITDIQECGIGGLCYEPTTFDWNSIKRQSYTARQSAKSLGSDTLYFRLPVDIDGDSYSDFAYVSADGDNRFSTYLMRNDGHGSLGNAVKLFSFNNNDPQDYPIRLDPVDINGDGNVELLFYTRLSNGEYRWQYYDDQAGVVSNVLVDTAASSTQLLVSESAKRLNFHDVNSDGYPDLKYVSYSGFQQSRESVVRIHLNKSDGTFEQYRTARLEEDPFAIFTNILISSIQSLQPLDVNNDGIADSIFRMSSHSYDLFTGLPFNVFNYYAAFSLEEDEDGSGDYTYKLITEIEGTRQPAGYVYDGYHIQSGDINGDGLGDMLYQTETNETGVGSSYTYWLSKGDGTGVRHTLTLDEYGDTLSLQLLDVNRDNRADILYFNTDSKNWRVRYQNKTGGFGIAKNLLSMPNYNVSSSVLPVDWTADGSFGFGRVDFASRNLYVWRDSLSENTLPNQVVMSKVTDGFGVSTEINYTLISQSSVYKRGEGAEALDYGEGSPVFDLLSPGYLVSSVDYDAPGYVDGVYDASKQISTQHYYEGMRVQAGGRGLLGFEKVYTYDVERGITSETTFRQDFPYIGMASESKQYLGTRTASPAASKMLDVTVNTLDSYTFQNEKTTYPYVKNSVETMYALNDAGLSTQKKSVVSTDNTYTKVGDNYLNMTGSVVITKDASNIEKNRVTTVNTFGADNATNWWFGRLTKSKVTHSRPGKTNIVRESDFTYDSKGMLKTETVAPNGGATLKLVTTHCYDVFGNRTASITDNATVDSCARTAPDTTSSATDIFRYRGMSYDTAGRYETATRSSLSKDLTTVLSRDGFGRVTSSSDINGVTVNVGFDAFSRAYATSNSLGQTGRTSRALAVGGVALNSPVISEPGIYFIERTVTAGSPKRYRYIDKVGRTIAVATEGFEAGSFVIQITRYDEFGNVVEQSNPHYSDDAAHYSITVYDKFSRPQSVTAPDGITVTATTYGADGLSTTSTVTSNHGISQTQIERWNVLGERSKVTDADNSDTTYNYDATGNLVKVENEGVGAEKSINTMTFDAYGRKTAMNDPGKGSWSYTYNALGEMTSQTDAKNQTMSYFRDSEGRTVKRTDHSGRTTFYEYNKATHPQLMTSECISTGTSCSTGIIEYAKSYLYDQYSRVDTVMTTIGSDFYMQKTTYDEFGRVFQTFDATGDDYGIRHHYNSRGYPTKQEEARYSGSSDSSLKKVYYEVTAMDAFGNVTEMKQNDGVITGTGAYDLKTGFATSMQAKTNNVLVQDNTYTFDGIGNLRTRNRGALKSTAAVQVNGQSVNIHNEAFDYDDLNRMTHINSVEKVRYMANGNISWKSDVGHYCYDAPRPHAVTGIGSAANCTSTDYQYDSNGNMTSGRGRTITYSDFDKPTLISNNKGNTAFDYDTGRNRYKRTTSENNETTVMYYIGNVEVVLKGAAANDVSYEETRRYLPGAIQTQTTGGIKNQYLAKDHLGSIDSIFDDNGKLIEKLYFDAWGKKVSLDKSLWSIAAANEAALTLVNVLAITPRGYTGHEHVDHADIIHMNGRIYDPTLGRFMQADPFIQAPANSQSYNRYSYVVNNPLSYTDPSGYIFKALGNIWKATTGKLLKAISNSPILSNIVNVALYIVPGCQSGLCHAAWNAATTYATTGSLRGAFTAGLRAVALSKIRGAEGLTSLQKGIASVGVNRAADAVAGDNQEHIENVSVQTQGNTASAVTGGKFGSGAVTMAFGGAFNTNKTNSQIEEKSFRDQFFDVLDAAAPTLQVIGGVGQVVAGLGACAYSLGLACGVGGVVALQGAANIVQGLGFTQTNLARDGWSALFGKSGGTVAFYTVDIGSALFGGVNALKNARLLNQSRGTRTIHEGFDSFKLNNALDASHINFAGDAARRLHAVSGAALVANDGIVITNGVRKE